LTFVIHHYIDIFCVIYFRIQVRDEHKDKS
jgi:hypothetical protein